MFDITTIPGSIIVTGDIGEMIVQRTSDIDARKTRDRVRDNTRQLARIRRKTIR